MMSIYKYVADGIALIHFGYIAFVVVGLAAILIGLSARKGWARNFWFRSLHLLAIVVVAAQALAGVVCPLTILERELRFRAGEEAIKGTFVCHWLHRLIFVRAEPWVFTLAYSLFGLLVLATFILAPPRRPERNHAI